MDNLQTQASMGTIQRTKIKQTQNTTLKMKTKLVYKHKDGGYEMPFIRGCQDTLRKD